mgnify:CR=1 FL=1
MFKKYAGILATIIITILYNTNDYKEGFTGENGMEIENPKVSTNTPYGAVTFSSPAEISQEEDEEDDDDDQLALLTEGQGPTNLSNNIE